MKRRLAVLTLSVVAATAGLSGCGDSTDYAAKVNGQVISAKTIMDELHTITSNPRYVTLLDSQLKAQGGLGIQPAGENTVNARYTAQLVFNRMLVELIDQAAAKGNIVPTPQQTQAAEQSVQADLGDLGLYGSLPSSYRTYLIDRQAKLPAITASRDTPQGERAYYESHQADFTTYCVSHILVDSQAEATQLRKQIVEDNGDFAALAKQFSQDNRSTDSSASNGGALGCFPRPELDQFIEVFKNAALALPANEVSQPVQSQFGYHLIKVTSKTIEPFDKVQSQISDQLSDPSTFLTEQLDAATVKVNPRFGVYHKGNPSQGSAASVTPPPVNLPVPKVTTTTIDPSLLGGDGNSGNPSGGTGAPDTHVDH